MSKHAAGPGKTPRREPYRDPPTTPRRKRVVLADARAPVTVLRTIAELEEQTSYGEELVRQFIRVQLRTALRFWLAVLLIFGSLPVLFFTVPGLSEATVVGVSLPWLLLGIAPFPVLFGIGYWYNRVTDRQERDFVAMVEK